jgi:hypothetical protein
MIHKNIETKLLIIKEIYNHIQNNEKKIINELKHNKINNLYIICDDFIKIIDKIYNNILKRYDDISIIDYNNIINIINIFKDDLYKNHNISNYLTDDIIYKYNNIDLFIDIPYNIDETYLIKKNDFFKKIEYLIFKIKKIINIINPDTYVTIDILNINFYEDINIIINELNNDYNVLITLYKNDNKNTNNFTNNLLDCNCNCNLDDSNNISINPFIKKFNKLS